MRYGVNMIPLAKQKTSNHYSRNESRPLHTKRKLSPIISNVVFPQTPPQHSAQQSISHTIRSFGFRMEDSGRGCRCRYGTRDVTFKRKMTQKTHGACMYAYRVHREPSTHTYTHSTKNRSAAKNTELD